MGRLFDLEPEGLLSKQQAIDAFAPYRDRFKDVLFSSFDDYRDHVSERGRFVASSCTQANFIHDFVKERAREVFAGDETVRFCMKRGFFKIELGRDLIVRVKKLARDLTAMNVRTKQQRRWFSNLPLAGLANNRLRLTVGYRQSLAGDAITDIFLTWQNHWKQVGWSDAIYGNPEVVAMPTPVPAPVVDPVPLVLKIDKAEDGRA